MKCEPHGPMQFDKTNDKQLGIEGGWDAQLQLMSSLIIANPISLVEAALTCVHIVVV